MALINCDFFSDTLGLSVSANIILPQKTTNQIGLKGHQGTGKFKTLWLLHGMSDDHTIWCRRTSIERYAAKYGIAVVMPPAHRSYYTDMASGMKFWSFLSEELPLIMREFFPLSDKREDNFVAGLSMGGYGAFKMAFNCPDKYAAAASLSGALDPKVLFEKLGEDREEEFRLMFGGLENFNKSENDLFHLAEKLKENNVDIPRLYQCCGTEDFLYEDNIVFRDFLNKTGIPLEYEEGSGEHEWGFWDEYIQKILRWIFRGK